MQFLVSELAQEESDLLKPGMAYPAPNALQAANFCAYLRKHRHRIVNYKYYHEQICLIGSGAVESALIAD